MKRIILVLIGAVIVLAAAVHGYFFLAHGDARPCQAATRAMLKAGFSSHAAVPTNPIRCYRIALRGIDDDTVQDSHEDRPRMLERLKGKQER
jgi:hypothetical protein